MFGGWNIGIFYISDIRSWSVSYEVAVTISIAHRYILEFSTYLFWTIAINYKIPVNLYLSLYVWIFFLILQNL